METTSKRVNLKYIILIMISILITLALSLAYFLLWRIPSSQEVFINAQQFVVELKSQTSENLITYGSAVILDKEGTIVSNAHMVTYKESGLYKAYESFEVRFSFETDYRSAKLIKYDIDKDIAILKLDDVSTIMIRNAKTAADLKVKPGDKVYAVGNGMNHGISISQGIVSLPQVNIDYDGNVRNVIQCDLTINEGNSGGALLDERGRLIGIISFRIKDNQGNPIYGVAFSIPIHIVLEFAV